MRAALARHCSFCSTNDLRDDRVFETAGAAIGTFRCPIGYPAFRDTGPTERCIVVFPRTAVWIRHEGSRPFLADPSLTTIYNAAQRYERFPHSPDGDRCDWFAVSDDLAREIVHLFDVAAADSQRPFRFEWAASTTALYLRQRMLLRRAMAGELDQLEGEEAILSIVAAVLAEAYGTRAAGPIRRRSTAVRHRDLAGGARAELMRTIESNRSVRDIARSIGASPYHLCRVFHACTGRTLHQYRTELRLRLALERLDDASAASNLSAIAHDLGFSSHSHFVRAMRRQTGSTPSALRALLHPS
jgi:AraC-like DNA-binding protein